MKIHINQLIDYYAHESITFVESFEHKVPPGRKLTGTITSTECASLIFAISGRSQFVLNGTSYMLEPGVVVHGGPETLLDKEVLGDQEWHYAVVQYKIPKEEEIRFPYFRNDFNINTGINSRIIDLIQKNIDSYDTPGALAAFKSKVTFMNLMEEIILSARWQLQDKDSVLITQAAEHIQEFYAERTSIAQLAEKFGFTRRQFTHLFIKHIGCSPIRYLTDCRIRKSKELLRMSKHSIAQIAGSVGYDDSFYFSRVFKKQAGLSPTEFREQFGDGY